MCFSAKTEPAGPVYLWASREVMEEHLDPTKDAQIYDPQVYEPLEPNALSSNGKEPLYTIF
jgi:hypothetical protein